MEAAEFFVTYLQCYFPSWLLLLMVRAWMKYVGPRMRSGGCVVDQIRCDRVQRKETPVTTEVDIVNEQHYGNDPAFFLAHLGPKLKYSACKFSEGDSLSTAEITTLEEYQRNAGIASLPAGSTVLELGCGWGSLTLFNAAKFPHLRFVGFSNSPQQIGFIGERAKEQGITNLTLHVEDYAVFVDPAKSKVAPAGAAPFDAAVAIETIEHAQNIGALLAAVADRLKPGAQLFVQSLLHQSCSYLMASDSWMGRNFFTGGSILALNSYFHLTPPSLYLAEVEPVNGIGYSKTLLAFLERLETKKRLLVGKYGSQFYEGFRMFYISCAEAFAANNGNDFMVGYYTFVKR